MFIQKKARKQKTTKSHWRLSLVKVFVILKAPYERIRINFIALMAPTSKMQTLIDYLFSTNVTVFDDFAFYIEMIDSAKIVGAFWIAKLMWNTTSSVPQKLLDCQIKVVLSFFFNCRKRWRIYKFLRCIWRIIVLFTVSQLCLTYVFDVATIVCWLPRIFAKRFVLGTFYSKFNSFEMEKYAL